MHWGHYQLDDTVHAIGPAQHQLDDTVHAIGPAQHQLDDTVQAIGPAPTREANTSADHPWGTAELGLRERADL